MHHSGGRPSLVFCSTRKGAQETAVALAQSVSHRGNQNPFVKTLEHFDRLQVAAQRSNNVYMQLCIRSGVGFHNGGLTMEDRSLVEELFLTGDLLVLCTTSTLAQGVNLPAHEVIIKSTQYYNQAKGCYVEYERSAILQMSGRAGRPQFDDSGVVIIMTRKESVHLYQNLLSGSEPVESQLLPTIVEHLNAEIVLMTVTDCGQAIDWLKCSYLYVRIKKNPQHYNIKKGVSPDQLENKLKEICVQNVNELAKFGLVNTDEFGYILTPLEPGRIMEKYYLQFETMKSITNAPERSSMEELILVLANAEELSWIKLRRDEKKRLNDINADMSGRIRYHVNTPNGKLKKRIQSDAEKIFVLVNDALSGEPSMTDFTMSQDINAICTTGTRICRCMSDYFIFMKRFRETRNALLLSKCLKQRLWENTKYQLKQLAGVGLVTAKALVAAGMDSFEKLASADPRRLETITGRKFPYGDQLKTCLNDVPPKVEMNLFENGRDDQCLLTLHRVSQVQSSGKSFHMAELVLQVVGSQVDNMILFRERIRMDQFTSPYAVTISCSSASGDPHILVVAALISEEYVGVDNVCKLALNCKAKDCEMGLDDGHGCQEPHTTMKHFYISPFKTSLGSNNCPTVSKLQNHIPSLGFSPSVVTNGLDFPRILQTAESKIPIVEASCRYASRNSNPSPVTLATRSFLNKLGGDTEASPMMDSLSRNPQNPAAHESNSSPELEVLEIWPTYPCKSLSSKTSAQSNSPEILAAFHSSDLVNTSLCTSSPVPAETLERSCCTSPTVTPQIARQKEVPHNAPRRLFRRFCTNNEEYQLKSGSDLLNDKILKPSPVIAQSDDVSFNTSMRIQGPCSTNNADFAENSADRTTTSNSRNLCNGESLVENAAPLFQKSQGTMHDDAELETGSEFNMTDQGSEPSRAAMAPPPSSLTSLPAASDLLSLNLRRKIRRTGFSTIPSLSSVDDNAQRNTMGTMNNIMQTSEKHTISAKTNSGIAKKAAIVPNSLLHQAPNDISTVGFTKAPMHLNDSVVNSALEVSESQNQESSKIDNRSYASETKRLKADNLQTNTVEESSTHDSVRNEFSCFKFDHNLINARPTSAQISGSMTTQPSPAGQQEFMGYKSLFSFL
ncbi:hypothetical protein M758_5G190600 [Ceratodon purpureus]|nr:hypothetical protein M758_5G190600 [Ceratodon purpureus]